MTTPTEKTPMVAPVKKTWAQPELMLISQNTVTGGGPHQSFKETAGPYQSLNHALRSPGGHKIGVFTATYNRYAHHS